MSYLPAKLVWLWAVVARATTNWKSSWERPSKECLQLCPTAWKMAERVNGALNFSRRGNEMWLWYEGKPYWLQGGRPDVTLYPGDVEGLVSKATESQRRPLDHGGMPFWWDLQNLKVRDGQAKGFPCQPAEKIPWQGSYTWNNLKGPAAIRDVRDAQDWDGAAVNIGNVHLSDEGAGEDNFSASPAVLGTMQEADNNEGQQKESAQQAEDEGNVIWRLLCFFFQIYGCTWNLCVLEWHTLDGGR